jgi:hypothetical protein
MPQLAPAILVLEKRRRWEVELRQSVAAAGVLVRPCRSTRDLLNLCRLMPGSVAVIDLETGAGAALKFLDDVLSQRLAVTPVAIASADLADLEWPLRELGTAAVLRETQQGGSLARLCRRLLTDHTSSPAAATALAAVVPATAPEK